MSMRLFAGVSLAAILIGSGAAIAQDADETNVTAPNQDDQKTLDTVVVAGFRTANSAAIADKRDSDRITDGINQDTIGLLPDLSVADIARRIPGVTSVSSTGMATDRSISSAENIVIRGLSPSFNLATFDGAPIATASESERAANLSMFPPSIIGRVEAVKTLTADMNPHGLSGQLNLVTASAFDHDEAFGNFRFSMGDNSTAGKVVDDQGENIRASGLFGTTFGAQDQFGLVVSGSYEKFYSTTRDERPGGESQTYLFYTNDPTDNSRVDNFGESNGLPAPRRNQIFLFENEQERVSAVAKLEWRPSVDTKASVFAGWFKQDEQETRHEHLDIAEESIRPVNQTATTGEWLAGAIETGFSYQPEETTTTAITGRFEHNFNEDHAIDLTGSFSRAKVDVVKNMSKFLPPRSAATAFSYDMSSGRPVLDFNNPDIANDPSIASISYIRERTQDIQQDLTYLDGAWKMNYEASDRGFGFKAGATYLNRDHSFDREYIQGSVYNTAGCAEADIQQCPVVTFDQYIEDNVFPTTDPDVNFYLIDDARLRADWIAQGKPLTTDRTDNSISSDYTIDETIYGLYAQGVYKADRFKVQAGLRYDTTEVDVDLYVRDQRLPSDPDSAQYRPEQRAYEYDFLLPSLIGTFEASDNLLLRAAYTRTIGRPNYEYLKRAESFGVPNDSEGTISISRGNPDLKPLVSDNLDISAEYYFDNGGSLISLAGFHKDVEDLIYVLTTEIPDFEYEGQSYTATVNQPINASSASIYGLELGFRKDFANTLPAPFDGFVFDGNLTWIGSEFTYVNDAGVERDPGGWLNQPELLVNAQLSYEKGPFGAKVAYNYVDEYLSNILADAGDIYDVHAQPRGVLDVQARYQLTDRFTILGEVQNLTEEGMEFNRRFPSGDLLAGNVERGRVIWLGVNFQY
ncbi:TonB-dependent receptor [Ponticaulis profundi]|uniref:TonB-dependent receptor n=1 Tax=Ponticaulis profundi TaxID=2665222 RepID=A0ABW1SDQ1_9PROT